jgi:hypothetical protein
MLESHIRIPHQHIDNARDEDQRTSTQPHCKGINNGNAYSGRQIAAFCQSTEGFWASFKDLYKPAFPGIRTLT